MLTSFLEIDPWNIILDCSCDVCFELSNLFEILKRTYSYFLFTMCTERASRRKKEKKKEEKYCEDLFYRHLTFLLCNMIHVVLSNSLNMFKIKH